MSEENNGQGKPQTQVLRLVSVDNKIAKADADSKNVVHSNALDPEDEYKNWYVGGSNDAGVLEPPYPLRHLDRLSQENNALSPCIEAMVTNVDGTGYDFERTGEDAETSKDDAKIKELREFFDEPWPGQSFTSIRKLLRRDLERTGNAYLEILRNAQDEIVFMRHVDSKMMRLVNLDSGVPVDRKVRRKGREVTITIKQRERKFVQLLNGTTLVYFREFGSSRDLNKRTAAWSEKGQRLPAKDRATEIIHFTALPDAHTPYGVPRWISQLPSVLGSRKAEEYNLDFFDNGGIPPVLILLQGGTLQPETKGALDLKMGRGTASKKNRVQVLEVMPSGGTFNSPNQARVTVERFGAERQDDSMFEGYDEKCETRVRRAFRLPPIFVGAAEDYSFASATASYAVAEAQVFKPERDEFDEIINVKLVDAMGYDGYRLVSKPLVIEDATIKLQGIQMAISTNAVEKEDVLYEINEASGTDIRYKEPEKPKPGFDEDGNPLPGFVPPQPDAAGAGAVDDEGNVVQLKTKTNTVSTDKPTSEPNGKGYTGAISKEATTALRLMTSLRKRDVEGVIAFAKVANEMTGTQAEEFGRALATARFPNAERYGLDDLGALSAATINVMAGHGCGCSHAG
ncbi:phage portal protein [Nitratireductor sp. OM-1]|uniref:phage portal protein n=1 Tax=Nitratireductor sp. OM-1 TaxID=1756988 RepID=UPI000DE06795|nr:phage portal protein [Nitratireductor sp. OM-1]